MIEHALAHKLNIKINSWATHTSTIATLSKMLISMISSVTAFVSIKVFHNKIRVTDSRYSVRDVMVMVSFTE